MSSISRIWRPFALVFLASMIQPRTAETQPPDDEAAIRQTVFAGQRAGWQDHDLKRYMAQWTEDAKVVTGRVPKAGKYDVVLDRHKVEATRRLLFRGDGPIERVDFDNIRLEVTGDQATLHVLTTVRAVGGFVQAGEVYRLRKTAGAWKVFENRTWPVKLAFGSGEVVFDAEAWKKADAAVDTARRSGDQHELALALRNAWRHAEAYRVSVEITKLSSAGADDWVLRGELAMQIGDADDALRAFRKALSMAPDAPVPSYAVPLRKKDAGNGRKRYKQQTPAAPNAVHDVDALPNGKIAR